MMHWLVQHHPSGDAVKDYSLAGALTSSPIWAPYLADVNGWLTTLTLVGGLILLGRRLWRDFRDGGEKK
jgi:hypothetical protein